MKRILYVFFGLLLIYKCALADSIPYSIRHFTDENGLPQNSVKFIVPDSDGFLWIATENGVVKFSGQDFVTYNRQNLPISSNRISHIIRGCVPGSLYALTDKSDIILIKDGRVESASKKAFRIHGHSPPVRVSLPDIYRYIGISNLYKDHVEEDTFFLRDGNRGVYRITHNSIEFDNGAVVKLLANPAKAHPWRFFLFNHELYYLAPDNVLHSLKNGSLKPIQLSGDIQEKVAFRSKPGSLKMYLNPAVGQVFLYIDRSLYLVRKQHGDRLETSVLIPDFDFGKHTIACVYYDTLRDRIFLGSFTNGLYVFSRKQFFTTNAPKKGGEDVHYAQAPFGKDRVLSTHGNVFGLRGHILTLQNIRERSDNYSLITDRKGNIWTKKKEYLSVFDRSGKELLHEWPFPSGITAIYEDRKGSVWVATAFNGLYRLDYARSSSLPVIVCPYLNNIIYIQQASDTSLYMASNGALYLLNPQTGKIDPVNGLEGKDIRSLYVSGEEEIWVTTYGDGFFLYKKKKLVQFPLDKNKYLASAHCIMEDDKEHFWIPTNKGLFVADKNELLNYAHHGQREPYYYYFGKTAGFITNEFNGGCQPCALKLANGFISFPSMNGLVWVNPDKVKIELPDSEIFVRSIALEDSLLPVTDTLRLPAGFHLLKLTVATPYFGNSNNIYMEYAVSGSEDAPQNWRKVEGNKNIVVSSLSSGLHRLAIRKRSGFGADNYTCRQLILIVDSVFYQTWKFWALMALLLMAAVWAYTKLRLRYVKRKNELLQQRIDQHTRKLQETLEQLTASEHTLRKQNRIQELLLASISHDIKNPLKYLVVMIRHLKQHCAVNQYADETLPQHIRVLYDASYRMYHLTENLLEYIKLYSRTDFHSSTCDAVCVHDLIEQKIAIFHDIAFARSTVIVNNVSPDLNFRSNSLILGIVIHNLLDNAIKFTSEGKITISAKKDNQHHSIIIEDTGIGIDPETVHWHNEYYNETKQDVFTPLPRHSGLGLIIVGELIRILNGKVFVESEHNTGTRFVITLST